jgi:cleavage and polyadenylation specificity factor subunit 1
MLDEETGAEPRVLSASIADPYILLIRDDSSVWFGSIDKNCDLEEMDYDDEKLLSKTWTSGCLYADKDNHFVHGERVGRDGTAILAFLMNAAGTLYVSLRP